MQHEIKLIDEPTSHPVIELDGVRLNLPYLWEEIAQMKEGKRNE